MSFFFDCPRFNNDVIWHFISRSSLSLTAPPICSVVLHKQTDTIDMYKIDFQNYVVFLYITMVESISLFLYEPHHEKTGFLHMRKQRRRSAVQKDCLIAKQHHWCHSSKCVSYMYMYDIYIEFNDFQNVYHVSLKHYMFCV